MVVANGNGAEQSALYFLKSMKMFEKTPPPSFTSRSEAFDYAFAEMVCKGIDLVEAANKANEFADIVAKNKGLPDMPEKPKSAIDKGIEYAKQFATLKEEHPEVWDIGVNIVGGFIGSVLGAKTVEVQEPKERTRIDFSKID